MKRNLFNKLTSLVLVVMLAFTVLPSGIVLSKEVDFEIELTTDKYEVSKDGTVTLTITAKGDFKDIVGLQYFLVYDPTDFSADGKNTGTRQEPRYDNLFDSEWFDANNPSDFVGISEGLDDFTVTVKNYADDQTKNRVAVMWITSADALYEGYYINESCDIYGSQSVVLGKIKLTALKDVSSVASSVTLEKQAITYFGGIEANTVAVQLPNIDMSKVEAANNAITLIPETVTYSDKATVEAARSAYGALNNEEKALVTGADKISVAESTISGIQAKIDNVESLIDAIGEVTLSSQQAILDAKNAYNELKNDEKAAVSNKNTLDAAEERYTELLEQAAQEAADRAAAKEVSDKIAAIGTVTIDSENDIKNAEDAYYSLTQTQKGYVVGYDVLTKARETYNTIVSNKNAADEVVNAIIALPSPESVTKDNVNEVAASVASVRTSYENLADKTFIADEYIEMLEAVEAACQTVKDDLAAAKAVDDEILAIGTVSLESLAKIENAEDKYEALSQKAKTYVTKYDELLAARTTYNTLKEEKDAVDGVISLITDIGAVEDVDLNSIGYIEAAEEAYEGLDDKLKIRVSNYSTLVAAREKYNSILESKSKIDAVIAMIDAIEEVTLQSKAAIEAAEKAYDALSDDEKGQVDNYQDLLDARDTYQALFEAAEKEEIDRAAAQGVDNLIAALGEITLESELAVTSARNTYNALTDDQKAYVQNLSILEAAEETLAQLKSDKLAVDEVIALINEIGEVKYPDSEDAINIASVAYDALSDALKGNVTNIDILISAQQIYSQLETDYNDVDNVINLIDAIGEVKFSKEVKQRIDIADEAYLGLREELRARVTNAATLEAAKALYETLKPVYSATTRPVSGYDDVYVVVFSSIDANKKISLGGTEAYMYTKGEDVYYVVATNRRYDPMDVVIEEGTPKILIMGDADGNGIITANDALAVNQKSANHAVDYYDDVMSYIRTDINGSGTITAYDALMVARIAAGVDVVTNFVSGDNTDAPGPSAGGGGGGSGSSSGSNGNGGASSSGSSGNGGASSSGSSGNGNHDNNSPSNGDDDIPNE